MEDHNRHAQPAQPVEQARLRRRVAFGKEVVDAAARADDLPPYRRVALHGAQSGVLQRRVKGAKPRQIVVVEQIAQRHIDALKAARAHDHGLPRQLALVKRRLKANRAVDVDGRADQFCHRPSPLSIPR